MTHMRKLREQEQQKRIKRESEYIDSKKLKTSVTIQTHFRKNDKK